MRFRKQKYDPMPRKFDDLARYNSEVMRGLVHAEGWTKYMEQLQAQFVQWSKEQYGSSEER
jgi:hypothetical protein